MFSQHTHGLRRVTGRSPCDDRGPRMPWTWRRAALPRPGRQASGRTQRAGGQMRLKAGHARYADDRIVVSPGGQLQTIARRQGEPSIGPRQAAPGQAERDRAGRYDDHLVVRVAMCRVAVARPIAPATGIKPLGSQAPIKVDRSGHHREVATPISRPTKKVTVAASAPMPTWRAPLNRALRPVSRLIPMPTTNIATRLNA